MTKVVALLRVSTEEQAKDDRGGLLRQKDAVELTIQKKELECVEIVTLTGVSGTEVRQNPEIIRILRMIENRELGGVVVADLDRLMRPARGEDYALIDVFTDAKARIFTSGMEFDLGHPVGKLLIQFILGVAEFERQLILDRTMKSVRRLCKDGQHPFGPDQLPRGVLYDRATREWKTNEKILPVLEAYRLIDEEGIHNIAEVARRTGINERALHNLVRNPIYVGWRIYATGREARKVISKRGRAYKRKVPLPEAEIIRVLVFPTPPVTMERFNRVQTILRASFKAWKSQRSDRPDYNLLRSVARCDRCESRLYFSQDRRRPNTGGYYFCSKNYYKNEESKKCSCGASNQSKVILDGVIEGFMEKVLSQRAVLRSMILHSIDANTANRAQPPVAKPAPANFDLRRKRLKDGFENGIYSAAEVKERLAAIDAEELSLKQVNINQAKAARLPQVEKLVGVIVNGAYAFRRIADSTWRLRVIQRMFSAIYLADCQVTRFTLQPSVFQEAVCEDLQKGGWDSSRRRA
jgi:DNA invertase Pin-like site-specific DNA recombinase